MSTRDYRKEGAPGVGSDQPTSVPTLPIRGGETSRRPLKGRYQIVKELGRGGIGVVYLADDLELRPKQVVIKVLLEKSAQDAWYTKKFGHERQALANLDHPGIVSVLDSGRTPDDQPFLVMQYIKGQTLRERMPADRGMDFKFVAQVARQVGAALTAAHEVGVVHCDLKPENIMLQDLGEGDFQAKIVDFGIAKVLDARVSESDSETKVAGTLPYMAAEQLLGSPSQASDIFALGVIAYELLTGHHPFKPPTPYQTLEFLAAGVQHKPKEYRPDLPDEAQAVLLKALLFEPTLRPERARDFGELLAQALTTDLELPATQVISNAPQEVELELAHVLFTDIVGYSKVTSDQQIKMVGELRQVVTGTDAYRRAKEKGQVITRPTGDGMALAFFSGPQAAAQCAIEVATALRAYPHLPLRMGINSGPVYRHQDVNNTTDLAGAGINMAQRVMDCGDAGHILLSRSAAEVLKELAEYRDNLRDLGQHKVKHGVPVHLYNLHVREVGNPKTPSRLRKGPVPLSTGVLALVSLAAIVAVGVMIWLMVWPGGTTPATPNNNGVAQPPPPPVRSLGYALDVWKTGDRVKECGKGNPNPVPPDATFVCQDNLCLRLRVNMPQPGYLYVLNEPPDSTAEKPRYIMLYPSAEDRKRAAGTNVEVPPGDYLACADVTGNEKLLLVWSEKPLTELEAVIETATDRESQGEVRDAGKKRAIQALLAQHPAGKLEKDEAQKVTLIKGTGEVLVGSLTLQHF